MVSMSKPQGAAQAEGYLAKENYYQQNSEIGKFHGDGLQYLGIEKGAEVTAEIYNKLLNGYDPRETEKVALHPNSGTEDRRAGIDVTFSAPKSVSVLLENYEAMGQNDKGEALRNAHEKAVQDAMKKLEENYAKTRIYGIDKRQYKVDAKPMYATFQHDTSREVAGNIDPQLHSHNFIFTTVFYEDKTTGEVKNLALSNEEIYQNKMYLGQLYRSSLASNLKDIGYTIEVTDRSNGFFEVEGFSKEQLEEFSTRSKMVREKLSEYKDKYPNMGETELLSLIVTDTKNAKKEINRDAVRSENLDRMEQVGIDAALIDAMQNESSKKILDEAIMKEHIAKSLDNLMDKQSLFTQEDLSSMMLKYGLEHGYNENDYMQYVVSEPNIIKLDDNVFSTQKMIDAEKNIIKSIHQGREQFSNFEEYESSKVRDFLTNNYPTMTDEQVKMVRFVLGNKDQFVAIQGDAGTGKTFAGRAIKEYLEAYHDEQKIIGLSFTGKATQGLEIDTGIKSSTVHSFLAQEAIRKEDDKNRLIIVDEAGMVGSLQMEQLIENATKNGDRIVFMGDTKQFKSISAGNIFSDMQKWGTKTVKLSQSLRQESELTKEAVTSMKEQMVKKSFSIIEENGKFFEDTKENQITKIAQNYTQKSVKKQDDVLIIASTNKDKNAINTEIRKSLNKAGEAYTVQENVSLEGIKKHYAQGYKVGDGLSISGSLKGFKDGQKLIITGSAGDKVITVKGTEKNAQEKEINVYEYGDQLQVYRETVKPFEKGDVIIFTKNAIIDKNTKQSVKNGERTRIKSINENGDVETTKGKKFNIKQMPYVDYGYAITDVKSQGTTVKNVVIMAQADMANFNSFYTQITRAKRDITLYTDNKEALQANVQKTNNTKTTLDYTIKIKEKSTDAEQRKDIAEIRGVGRNISKHKYPKITITRKRSDANEKNNVRNRQDHDSVTGKIGRNPRVTRQKLKVKGDAESLPTTRKLSKFATRKQQLQHINTDVRNSSIHSTRTSLYGLPQRTMVHNEQPSPKVLLQRNVLNRVGRERPTDDNELRWQGDSHNRKATGITRGVENTKIVSDAQSKSTQSMSLQEKLHAFAQKSAKTKNTELEK